MYATIVFELVFRRGNLLYAAELLFRREKLLARNGNVRPRGGARHAPARHLRAADVYSRKLIML